MKKMRDGYYASWWFDAIYRQNYYLLVRANAKDVEKYFKRNLGIEYKATGNPSGRIIPFVKNNSDLAGIVIWIKKWNGTPFDYATLAHEMLHAADHTLKECHVEWGNSTSDINEAQAYYLGYLMRKALDEIETKRELSQ